MNNTITMLIIFIVTGAEIFFNVLTTIVSHFILLFKKDFKINKKLETIMKLIVVALFFMALVFFLMKFVKITAVWLNIPLNKSIFELFK